MLEPFLFQQALGTSSSGVEHSRNACTMHIIRGGLTHLLGQPKKLVRGMEMLTSYQGEGREGSRNKDMDGRAGIVRKDSFGSKHEGLWT